MSNVAETAQKQQSTTEAVQKGNEHYMISRTPVISTQFLLILKSRIFSRLCGEATETLQFSSVCLRSTAAVAQRPRTPSAR